ncbi:MAG: tetratricopeptide repeat protein [Leptolyngbyaceae cyanobacterium bins.302]|nr:tetratricopeptide repeat protein [Leptolyngbyaceae cyanobacterium bins.302]
MDYQRFLRQLPDCYHDWQKDSIRPKSEKFQQARDRIQGMTTANVMQLLNWAVDCLEPDELYCEIGTYQGTTLIGALLDHPDRMAYAVDNFSEFDPDGTCFAALMQNLNEFGMEEQVYFCNQDFQQFLLELKEINTNDKIGVYFYDGAHDYRSTLLGLLLAKPFLSDRALILLDDANWGTVQQACWDFLAASPEAQVELELLTPVARFPTFWNGIQILSWDRTRTHNYAATSFHDNRQENVVKAIYNLQLLEQREETIELILQEATYAHQQKQFSVAEKKYREYLLWNENSVVALTHLGLLLYEAEDYQESHKLLQKVFSLEPENSLNLYYLGSVLSQLNETARAIAAYQAAIRLDPNLVNAYNNLGLLLKQENQLEQAEAVYREAIAVQPSFPGTYLNLGNLLLEQGNIDLAIQTYQTALDLDPANADIQQALDYGVTIQQNPAEFHQSFGHHFYQQQNYSIAIHHFQRYLEIQPGHEQVYLDLSEAQWQTGAQSDAIATLHQGLAQYPNSEPLYYNLVTKLNQHGDTQKAIEIVTIACQQIPDSYILKLLDALILPYVYDSVEEIQQCRDRYLQKLNKLVVETPLETTEQKLQALKATASLASFYITYQARSMVEPQQLYGRLVQRIMAANFPQWIQSLPQPPVTNKIRVGYLTHYFYAYSGTLWLTGWLRHTNHDEFEIYCYHTGSKSDTTTEEFQAYSDVFRSVSGDLATIAQQVLADQLHILVFPEIGMDAQTVQLAALRLAPVQCTAWGHPVTSGLTTVDYYLSSEWMEPIDGDTHYTEQLVRLPNLGIAYPQPMIPPLTKSRADFGLPEDGVVYFCGQAPFKYLPQHDRLLVEIAQRLPKAQFVFLRADVLRDRLQREFAKAGLNSVDHCVFLPALSRSDYLMLNLLCDGFLDTIGFTGGNTTFDAIACGLPVITYPQEFMRGRMSYGILQALGVADTIAHSEAEYVELAVRLGTDPDWKKQLSQTMLHQQERIFDDQTCIPALEEFYRQVSGKTAYPTR